MSIGHTLNAAFIRRHAWLVSIGYLCFFFAVNSAWAVDPNNYISQDAHTAWRIQDGMFNGAPHAVAQTADGYIWIGTEGGLVRFDEVRFVPWTEPAGKHLSRPSIYSILGSRDGSLWIGSGDGLARLTKGDLVNYPETFGRTNAIVEDQQGTVWTVRSRNKGQGALCKVAGDKARCYGAADGLNCPYGSGLGVDREGNLWVGSPDALCRWKDESSDTYLQKVLKKTQSLTGVTSIGVGKDGSLWAGIDRIGKDFGLQQFIGGAWRTYSVPGMNGASLSVNRLFVDRNSALFDGAQPGRPPFQPIASKSPDGRLWFANENVLQMIDPSHLLRNLGDDRTVRLVHRCPAFRQEAHRASQTLNTLNTPLKSWMQLSPSDGSTARPSEVVGK